MGRIRTIKPEFFLHYELAELEQRLKQPLRLFFIGLWTQADREGRFRWRLRPLQAVLFPYQPDVDVQGMLEALSNEGYVRCYACPTRAPRVDTGQARELYGQICTFLQHQYINAREHKSTLPKFDANCELITFSARVPHASTTRGRVRHTDRQIDRETDRQINTNTPSADASASVLPVDTKTPKATRDNRGPFAHFWERYPRRVAKGAASKAFDNAVTRLIKSGDSVEQAYERLAQATERLRTATAETEQRFIPHPSTWLNQERYFDEAHAPNTGGGSKYELRIGEL